MARRVLLVEGDDDERVLRQVCRSRALPQPDKFMPCDGVDALLKAISVHLRAGAAPGDVVGVVVDADADPGARWQAVRDRLSAAGYADAPSAPDPDGTVLEPPAGSILPKAGIWLMPDNSGPGILEDFLRFLVPAPNVLFDHAEASVASIPERLFSPNDEPKALIHTWLAWQKEPGRPYGTAIAARFLNPDVPQVRVLAEWLRRLFVS